MREMKGVHPRIAVLVFLLFVALVALQTGGW